MNAGRKRVVGIIVAAVLVAGVGGGAAWWQFGRYPKRFAAVVPGALYRSGEVSAAQLARLQKEQGIERVICLLDDDAPQTQAERAAAEALGIEWHNVSLRGNGASTPADQMRLLQLLTAEDASPTLVHCAAGVNRTGLAVGLYRIHEQGWDYERVLDEMRRFDFDDLPKHENLRQALRKAAEEALRGAAIPVAATQPATE
jgi:protein tyrosine/serine phosphatase